MANRGGCTVNGKHFAETLSSGFARPGLLRRYFIDGKLVAKSKWLQELAEARKAEKAAQGAA